jgi:hypothetical protein
MPRDTGETHTPSFQVEGEQHVVGGQTSPRERIDGAEINSSQDSHMRSDELAAVPDITAF